MPAKNTKKPARKAAIALKKKVPVVTKKSAVARKPAPVPAAAKTYKVYIESCAFFPMNSSDGYVDHFQDGRHAAIAGRSLAAPVVVPVKAKLKSISVHYTNTTKNTPIAFFLRKHTDRHSPSGEIEMSFINLPPTLLPPDNYLTVTDSTFPDGNVIQDKFLHYLEVSGTGDFGAAGRITVRGMSLVYTF